LIETSPKSLNNPLVSASVVMTPPLARKTPSPPPSRSARKATAPSLLSAGSPKLLNGPLVSAIFKKL
jgi:hypothetical protein